MGKFDHAVTTEESTPTLYLTGIRRRIIEDFAHALHGKKVFSKIDLVRAYNQILVALADIEKTAITNSVWSF